MIMFDNDETRWFGSGNTLVNKGCVGRVRPAPCARSSCSGAQFTPRMRRALTVMFWLCSPSGNPATLCCVWVWVCIAGG